jgi:hypothetical protein
MFAPPGTQDYSIDVPVPLNLDPSDAVGVSVHFMTNDTPATGSTVQMELDLVDPQP